ncbi:MAG: hypothetical protein WCQ32_02780 [bacterium]
MENKKLVLREASLWFIQHALEIYNLGTRDSLDLKTYKAKLNDRLFYDYPVRFTDNSIVGKYGWIHPVSDTDEQRLAKSELYQSIYMAGVDVSEKYPWYTGISYSFVEKDAPFAEPHVKVSDEYEGTLVHTLRLNLFIDDNPDFEHMTTDAFGNYIENSFQREVVVVQPGDQPVLIPCQYAWLLSPDWDSYSKKAQECIVDMEFRPDCGGELLGWWGPFKDSNKFSTLFY